MGLGIVGKTKSKFGNGAASAKSKGICFYSCNPIVIAVILDIRGRIVTIENINSFDSC